MGFPPRTGRLLATVLLAWWAGILVSWCGIVTLITLSVLSPGSRVPQILLATWLVASGLSLATAEPGNKWTGRPAGSSLLETARGLLVLGPFHPLLRAGLACYGAWTGPRR